MSDIVGKGLCWAGVDIWSLKYILVLLALAAKFACINYKGRSVGHNKQQTLTPSRAYGVDIEVPLTPRG